MSNKDQIKEQILLKIEDELISRKFDDIRLDSIAKELHISKRTVYEIFASKDEIFTCIVKRFHEGFVNLHEEVVKKIRRHELTFSQGILELIGFASYAVGLKTKEIWNNKPKLADEIKCEQSRIFNEFLDLAIEQNVVRSDLRKNIYLMILNAVVAIVQDPKERNVSGITHQDIPFIQEIIHCGILTDNGREIFRQTMAEFSRLVHN